MEPTIELKGGKELFNALRFVEKNIEKRIATNALRAGARFMVKKIRLKARRRTGKLGQAKSWTVKPLRKNKNQIMVRFGTRAGKNNAWYAHLLEFGTSRHRAYPFFRPAMDENIRETLQIIGQKLFEGIEKESLK